MLSVGMIIGGAFRLIRERPGSVLVWGGIYSLASFALAYLLLSTMAPMTAMGERPDPNVAMAAMGGIFARMMLLYLAILCLYTVLQTAAQRAVLRPEESGFASIRLGGDELRMIGLAIFLGFLFLVFYLIAFVILGIIAVALGAAGAASGGISGGLGAMGPVMIVGFLLIVCALVYFWIRVSLAFPLTLMRRRFVLAEAWRLSRGHFWTLFGGYAVLILILVAIMLVVSVALQGSYWSQLMGGGLTGPAAQRAAQAQIESQYTLGPQMILSLAIGAVVGGLTFAFTAGATATAARALASDQQEMAQTFA